MENTNLQCKPNMQDIGVHDKYLLEHFYLFVRHFLLQNRETMHGLH